MSNLVKLEFAALDITGKNYLSWVLDAEIHLDVNNLGDTIKEENTTSAQDKAKAMIFLRHHIHELLKNEYLTVKDPLVLWTNLKSRICWKKYFPPFNASNIVLQQQYREKGFTKYNELISCLLVAEQNNELLMKNHEARPVGAAPFPEANVATYNGQGRGRSHYRGRGRGRGRGYGGNYQGIQFKNKGTHQKL
uniref:uncharacterized protein LOC122583351 n=1 Tax=Erigeron canadensis TaxID=72917 RepID=UPI001CB8E974|nr:uncharacterized protein LOC122583351 [Erigeron canadensis]